MGGNAPQQPDAKDPTMTKNVANSSEGEHQAGVGQDIADDYPLDCLDRQTEAPSDIGERDIDRGVERNDRRPQAGYCDL
jgi:hypothetical protein